MDNERSDIAPPWNGLYTSTIDLIMAAGRGIPGLKAFNDKLKHEDDQFVSNFFLRKCDNGLTEEVHDFHTHLQAN